MYKKLVLLSFLVLTLTGCSKKTMSNLGLSKGSPDEFTIIPNQPLTVPPMFELKDPNLLDSNTSHESYQSTKNVNDKNLVLKEDKKFLSKFDSMRPFELNKSNTNNSDNPTADELLKTQDYIKEQNKKSKLPPRK